ncbi:MAG TPA: DNA primase [Gaiellaceae bacterium]|nr:DNA primase [Gaiellaceae bacterium]
MARIKDSSVEAVKSGADFVAVVEDRTALRKVGSRLTGRCPFHEERTPSFSVNPVDKLYYCFGCGAKGDLITFVRETQGLDFVGAIEWLADRFRIPLEYEEASPEQEARRERSQRLRALLEQAAAYYERTLWETEAGGLARDYLKSRNLGEDISREFRLGLALGGDSLSRKAIAKGFTQQELRAAGLSRARGGDYFQRRLLFPLSDARGRIVGFQARKLYDDDPLAAKYVNTPESELFHKGSVVYGLDKARSAISRENRACVVEGNTDVIALRQAGFEPVVASMGTALTEAHLRELGRLTKRLWLAFDGDAAGEAATLRGMELAVAQGFDVRVVALKGGVDPADDPSGFERKLGAAEPYLVYRTRVEIERADDRAEAFKTVKALLDAADESPARQDAWRYANDKLGMTVQLARAASTVRAAAPATQRVLDAGAKLERNALAGALRYDRLRTLLSTLSADHFDDPLMRRLRDHIVDGAPLDADDTGTLAELDARAEAEGIDETTGEELVWRLRERELRRELQHAPAERLKELTEALTVVQERVGALS